MKLKLRDKKFLKKHENRSPSVIAEMLKHAGKRVTVNLEDGFDPSNPDATFSIEEDNGDWSWAPWMFERFPKKFAQPKYVALKQHEACGNEGAFVKRDGSVTIGCTTVLFKAVERLYKAAKKERARK